VNNYGGATIIDNNYAAASTNSVGLVQLGVDNALPTGTALSFGRVLISGLAKAGALDLNGHNQMVTSLASASSDSINFSLTNGISNGSSTLSTLTINGSATTNYNGSIGAFTAKTTTGTGISTIFNGTDNIALTLASTNSGNLTLSGTSTYSGPTTINGGTLAVTGNLTSSPVAVNSSGTLQGTGTLGSTLSVSSGGSVKPGAFSSAVSTTGALTVAGTTTFNNGAALNIVLAGESAGSQYSELHAQGQLNLGGSLIVSLSSFTPNVGDSFDILDWGSLSGTFNSLNLPNSFTWDTSQLYNTGVITVTGTSSFLAGDLNQDTFLSVADVKLMLSALTNPDAFSTSSGLTLAQIDALGDVNQDGFFTNADIQALINQILAGNHSTSAVPEPAGFVLAAVGLAALVKARRRKPSLSSKQRCKQR
jgi:autotransporter-associated beta strand protein